MKKREAVVITLLSLAVFLLAFLISGRLWFRVDMTRNRAYTISELSGNLYREISDRVTITYFVSQRLSASHPMPGGITDLLREYAARSRGRIRFLVKDPAEAGLSRIVEDLGIIPWQIQAAERNETTHATVYSGILIEYLDREEVIPLVFSLDTLEYDLSSRIRSLVRNTNRYLGIIAGDAHREWQTDYALLNHALVLSGFRPELIIPGSRISPALPALFVLGGAESLDVYHLRPIDEYIQGGGNVFFALNGVFVDSQGSLEARAASDMGLLAMLANFGFLLRRALVLDRASLNLTFQTRNEGGTQVQSVRYPPWIAVQDEGVNPGHPVSARAMGPDLFWPSPLELFPPPGVEAEVLFYSTDEAWLQTENFVTNPNLVSRFEDERNRTLGKKILAASLSGRFPAAFNDSRAFSNEPNFTDRSSNRSSRIIVVGDVNFAGPLMQTSQSEERNLEFLVRAAGWLSGEDDLLALRGRGQMPGRLDRISDPETRANVMAFSRMLNTFVIPLVIIAAGFLICRRRKALKGKGPSL